MSFFKPLIIFHDTTHLHTFDKYIRSKFKCSDFSLLELKYIKLLVSFLKQKVSLSSKFPSLFICHVIFETKSQFFFKLCITLQCHEKRDNSTVLSHLKLYMLSTKETHQVQIFGLSTARMKINQIPCHFSSHKSVFTYILHHLSVSWHIIYLDFSSWGITLWTKRAHESTNFQIFDCFNESSPNSSCQFWNHSVKVYSNFASMFSVMKDNSSVFFYLKPLYFGQKFSNFWVVGWKFTKFKTSYLKLQVSFSLKFASLFSLMRNNSSVLF